MAISLDSSSPSLPRKEVSPLAMATSCSSPLYSPSSEKQFWSNLRSRVDTLLENRTRKSPSSTAPPSNGESNRAKRIMKEDSLLLLRGFDSIAYSLSQLTSNLDNALQGARDLAKPPSLTEILHTLNSNNAVQNEEQQEQQINEAEIKIGVKRKFEPLEEAALRDNEKDQHNQAQKTLKKAKNLAVTMATKAATLAREVKAVKSELGFMQERCSVLEEENCRLRDGFFKGIRAEEDDLVRLQLEALLAEKSKLATENANLTRENQCLRQLVEYHQFASEDLSASYEQVIQGLCLDFSSPEAVKEEEEGEEDGDVRASNRSFEFSACLDDKFASE